jgi:hypothetical protein
LHGQIIPIQGDLRKPVSAHLGFAEITVQPFEQRSTDRGRDLRGRDDAPVLLVKMSDHAVGSRLDMSTNSPRPPVVVLDVPRPTLFFSSGGMRSGGLRRKRLGGIDKNEIRGDI